ncbi:MAG TPA: hypothetical protein PLP69_00610 [Bacteroidales bacterium]|nr:hypothetical protein [Bacteroidales bacterium]
MKRFTRPGIFLILFILPLNALSQQFDWKIGYLGFLDNREVDNVAIYGQTMFGSRLSGEIGVSPEGKGRFAAGTDFLYEFGWQGAYKRPSLLLYYENSYRNFNFSFGSFSRYNKTDMPIALLSDTLNYYRPEIQGLYFEYKTPSFRQNLWIDWTGRKTKEVRESFIAGMSGYYSRGLFIYQHHLVLNHISLTEPMEVGTYVRDNLGATVKTGLNLSSVTPLDSLALMAGGIVSLDRQRTFYDFKYSKGITFEVEAGYRNFGLHEMACFSDGLTILSGDSPYTATYYSRTDLYYVMKKEWLEAKIQFSYHHIPLTDMVSTMLVLRVNTMGVFKKHGE